MISASSWPLTLSMQVTKKSLTVIIPTPPTFFRGALKIKLVTVNNSQHLKSLLVMIGDVNHKKTPFLKELVDGSTRAYITRKTAPKRLVRDHKCPIVRKNSKLNAVSFAMDMFRDQHPVNFRLRLQLNSPFTLGTGTQYFTEVVFQLWGLHRSQPNSGHNLQISQRWAVVDLNEANPSSRVCWYPALRSSATHQADHFTISAMRRVTISPSTRL